VCVCVCVCVCVISTGEAVRIVDGMEIETAWFKFLNKSQLGDPCLMNLKCNGAVECVAYAPDGRKVATGSGDGFGGKVTIWDARSGSEMAAFVLPGGLVSLQFSGDGKLILAVSNEGTVMLADMVSFKERAREIIADARVSGGAITIDGKKMILVNTNGLINTWDLPVQVSAAGVISNRYIKMHEMMDEDDEGRPSPMTCVAVSPSVKRVVTGMSGGLIKIFELSFTEGLVVMHVLPGHTSVVPVVSFSTDSRRVVSASLDHTVKIWDAERGGKEICTFTDKAEIRACCFSPDGNFVAVGLDSGRMDLKDVSTAQTIMSFGTHAGRINSVQFDPNGKFLISGAMDGVCKVWTIQDSTQSETFTGHPNTDVTSCSYSIDGSELATSGGDGSIKLWGGSRGKEIMSFPGHDERVSCCVFSPLVGDRKGGVLTSSLYDGTVRLWQNLTGTEDEPFRHNSTYLTCMAFSPEKPPDKRAGRVLAGSFDGSVIIWDVETRNLIVKLGVEIEGSGGWRVEKIRDRHEDAVTSCAFSPVEEGERAITTSVDTTVKVWNTKYGNCVATLKGHSGSVNTCCFSNDGHLIYTASSDNTVREWEAHAPFKCLSIIIGHYAPVQGVAFATSGKHLFTISEDRTLRAWLKFPLEGEPGPNTPAARVGSQPFSVTSSNGRFTDWFQWKQIALFASAHPLRSLAGSRQEQEEEVACGAADGSIYLLRLILPGDF
jgi:WD40 repeat protein